LELAIAGGSNSVVESRPSKPLVAGSNPVSRSFEGWQDKANEMRGQSGPFDK
jgi:hypothetical protein